MKEPTVLIEPGLVPSTKASAIEDVLREISWPWPVYSIRVLRKFDDGRSGLDVLEVEFSRGKAVVKVGPVEELRAEYAAFDKVKHLSRVFMRILAASSSVKQKRAIRPGAAAGLVYEHAEGFLLGTSSNFEKISCAAVSEGDQALKIALDVLDDLMNGLKELYQTPEPIDPSKSYQNWHFWNEWLGTDALVEVDSWDFKSNTLLHSEFDSFKQQGLISYSSDLRTAVTNTDSKDFPDAFEMELKLKWWGKKLFGRPKRQESLLVEVVCEDALLAEFRKRTGRKTVNVQGVIRGRRSLDQRNRLLSRLNDVVKIENGAVHESDAREVKTIAADPFPPLLGVLDRAAKGFTSLVHGDLHGGNILVVQTKHGSNLPGVIDYRWLGEGRPILFDFVKLEITLTRNAFPQEKKQEKEFTWSQAIRLERLLALATRLGPSADKAIRKMLTRLDKRLANAFFLIVAIRRHARAIHPHGNRSDWHLTYAESLFLSAHSTLKWPNKTRWENIASLAVAAVAAEWLDPQIGYRWWNKKELADTVKETADAYITTADLTEISAIYRAIDAASWRLPAVKASLERAVKAHLKKNFRAEINELLLLRTRERNFYMRVPAVLRLKGRVDGGSKRDVLQILKEHKALVMLGPMGSGKTTIAQVWQHELASDLVANGDGPSQLSLVVKALLLPKDIPKEISREGGLRILKEAVLTETERTSQTMLREKLESDSVDWEDLLRAGAVHITVDSLNEVEESRRGDIVRWILRLREHFPRCPVLVCHREHNYSPGLLPFREVKLEAVESEEVKTYIRERFKERNRSAGESLIKELFDKPLPEKQREKINDLIQSPFLLSMIVQSSLEDALELESLTGRGALLSSFAALWLSGRCRPPDEQSNEYRYSVEEKSQFLNLIGHFLVNQQKSRFISLADIENLAAEATIRDWAEILNEIVDVGMLSHGPEGYKFRFQSFEEYFAAVHIFSQPYDPAELAKLIRTYAWHDTLVILVGYGDRNQQLLDKLIELSQIVDPVLTARILQVAEYQDRRLQNKFIKSQMDLLRTPDAGSHLWAKATEAIATLNSEDSLNCLMEIVLDQDAAPEARAEAVRRAALMQGR